MVNTAALIVFKDLALKRSKICSYSVVICVFE